MAAAICAQQDGANGLVVDSDGACGSLAKLIHAAPRGAGALVAEFPGAPSLRRLRAPPHGRRPVRGDPGLGYFRFAPPGRVARLDAFVDSPP